MPHNETVEELLDAVVEPARDLAVNQKAQNSQNSLEKATADLSITGNVNDDKAIATTTAHS